MRKILHIVALILFCHSGQFSQAQPRQFIFNRLSSKEGLASNFVYSIFQDRKGFMWFGTANGLQRYDGRKIVQFRSPPGAEDYLPKATISQMFEDRNGNVWVRSAKDVGIFDPATFRFKKAVVVADKEEHPRAEYELWQNTAGQVFLLIKRVGILAYDSASNTFAPGNNRSINLPSNWKIQTILEDRATKNYWLGCDSGIAVYDTRKQQLYTRTNNPAGMPLLTEQRLAEPVINLFADDRGRLWITSWNLQNKTERYACYNLNAGKFTTDTAGMKLGKNIYQELRGFLQQKSGTLWSYGRMQLFSFEKGDSQFTRINSEHLDDYGIRYEYIFTMFEDKEQNLWLGTDQGVYAMNPGNQLFKTVKAGNNGKTKDLSVTGFLETGNHTIYVSTWGQGTVSYDQNWRPFANAINRFAPADDNNFRLQWTLCEQPGTDRLWIGCQLGRIIIHEPGTGRSLFLNPKVFGEKTIRQIMPDSKGNIWFATQYGHLVKWNSRAGDPANFEKEAELVTNLQTIIYKIYEDPQGFIWAGTHEFGLFKLDPSTGKTIARYTSNQGTGRSLFSNIVTDIVPYTDSSIIVANGALSFVNIFTGQTKLVSANEGLPSNTVSNMEFDRDGSLWISFLSGLCRYNIPRHLFASFSQRDGIVYDNFQVGAKYRMLNGSMLFGNSHDFIVFQPDNIRSSEVPPDVTITDFKLFNTYLPPDSILKLPRVDLVHTDNSITIEFSALSYLQKDKILYYYYKLEGIDKDWMRTDRLPLANYTQLPPGDYTFKVWCENTDGVRSPGITSLKIHIRPPFWNTWWFMLILALSIAGVIYLVHRIKVNRLLDMEKVRHRIARDLHDDMGSTLSTINILSEMAKMKVSNDPGKTSEYIEKISDNSSRMMEAMDDIVWSINPMNDSMQKVAARMREFATGVLEAKNIDYSFKVDEAVNDLKLDMEARRDLFLLFKESINNLAKYSRCAHAEIEIRIVKTVLLMRIQDDGTGFDKEAVDSGNGLTNMRKRAQSLRGTLTIRSARCQGTTITLEAPVG